MVGLAVAAALAVTAPAARAEPPTLAREGRAETLVVPSSMGPVTVRVQWARHGGSGALYLLDGLRASQAGNGWVLHTDAAAQFAADDVTLVMPTGGESSFYADWAAASSTNRQARPYRWETFLTAELPAFLARYGIDRHRTAVAGLSMGASAALSLAAHHRDMFVHATALSGPLDWTLPGVRSVLTLAALQGGGYDLTALAAPDSAAWARLDPAECVDQLAGLPMFISAATGVPGPADAAAGLGQTVAAMGIEAAAEVSTRSFVDRLHTAGIEAVVDYPAVGTHSWPYWGRELAVARPYILAALQAD